jgi:prevent-host-death family protein
MVMTSAKVSELKARLSAYLAEVRNGGTVVVYDRSTPIAKITAYAEGKDDLVVVDALDPPAKLKSLKGVTPKKPIDSDDLLRELRQER